MIQDSIEKHFYDILNALSDGIFISNAQGVSLFVNRMYEQLTGVKSADIIGKNIKELITEGVFDCAVNPEVIKSGSPQTRTQKLKNGTPVVLSGFPVYNENSELYLVVTFVRNITGLVHLENEMQEQKKLIAQVNEQLDFMKQRNQTSNTGVFNSVEILKVKKYAEQIAKTDATLLILGETGTGKSLLAQHIHKLSNRSTKNFVKVFFMLYLLFNSTQLFLESLKTSQKMLFSQAFNHPSSVTASVSYLIHTQVRYQKQKMFFFSSLPIGNDAAFCFYC